MESPGYSNAINDENERLKIKQEVDSILEQHVSIQIKGEHNDNPFENIQLKIKEETIRTTDNAPLDLSNDSIIEKNTQIEFEIFDNDEGTCHMENENIKQEMKMNEESLVSYDYPSFDDSMDSNEAAALRNVEACLQDEVSIKDEHYCNNYDDHQKPEYGKVSVKCEPELTVTETHLISNKLINTTSTVTSPHDGIIESQTTKTLVMEILPMTHTGHSIALPKLCNPEEILPTTNIDYDMKCDDYQLNSITGNVLSLEQEAYGLLQAKKKKAAVKQKLECPRCPKLYNSKRGLTQHLAVHNTIDNYAMGVLKGKKTRKENYAKKNRLIIKIKKDKITTDNIKKEGYECTCGNVFQRRSRLETCLRSHNEFSDVKPTINTCYRCQSCSRQFKDKNELLLHRKKVHSKRFPCKFCPTDYNSRKKLFKHLQVHQKVQLMEYKVISEVMNGKQKLRCFMCSKTCSELSQLKSHVMDDHKEPYICPHCNGTFAKIIDFGNHTKISHPEVEGQSVLDVLEAFSKLVQAWKCDECGQQFHEADKLALHRMEKHNPDVKTESQFQCTDCRRVFITQKGLTSHRRVHHNTENTEEAEAAEPGAMCLECRKICKDMNALTSHMRLHSPERKYPCKYCDFRFATPEKRKAHAEIHTGDMKYVCFICEYQCSSENRLKHHKMSLKHVNMREYLLTGKPLIEEEESSSKKGKIKDSSRKKEKTKKERNKSPACYEEIEATCDICGDKFASESQMLDHKQTHPFIEFPNDDKPSRIFFK